jgi:hypothetical protein
MNRIDLLTIALAASGLALAGFFVPAAYADTILLSSNPTFQYSAQTVNMTSPKTESFQDGGAMNFTDQTTGANLLMYCVDVMDSINIGQPTAGYTPTPLSSYTPFTSTVQTNIEKLFTQDLPLVDSSDAAVGFQEALWTIIYANTGNPYVGNADSAANAYASTWSNPSNLSGAATNGYYLTVWSNGIAGQAGTNQILISFTPDAPAPEPSTWALVASGFAGVFLIGRRRRARS